MTDWMIGGNTQMVALVLHVHQLSTSIGQAYHRWDRGLRLPMPGLRVATQNELPVHKPSTQTGVITGGTGAPVHQLVARYMC